jgi:glycosyltransferase involved in cell wall biosynthesis
MQNMQNSISVVIPAFNEEESLPILINDLEKELENYLYEIIVIDDGSSDSTLKTLLDIRKTNNKLIVIKFVRNYGQTSALDAGFAKAKNDIVVTLDADLQNPPGEIHKVIAEIEKGNDVACGWRVNRLDSVGKKILSRLAFGLRKLVLNDTLHDAGCTLRAYRKDALTGLYLFGESHRFIHLLLKARGCTVVEIPVEHHERRFGKSKYGFGGIGLGITFIGVVIGLYLTALKVISGEALSERPLLLLAVLLLVIGTQFITFGVLADVVTKIYYDNSSRKYYTIGKVYD